MLEELEDALDLDQVLVQIFLFQRRYHPLITTLAKQLQVRQTVLELGLMHQLLHLC